MYPDTETLLATKKPARLLVLHPSVRSNLPLVILFIATTVGVFFLTSKLIVLQATGGMPSWAPSVRWLGVFPLVVFLEILRRYFNDLYLIGRDRITHFQGRISLTFQIPAVRCVDLRAILVEQGIVGRIFNYGDVHLCTAAQDEAEIILKGVIAPRALAAIIDELRQRSQSVLRSSELGQEELDYAPGTGE